jgi:hypothetical protein
MARAGKPQRIRDLPVFRVDVTRHPYMLEGGVASDVRGLVPYQRGGFKRMPQWASHFLASTINANAYLCGLSPVGPITQGGTAQITAAVNITGGNSTQHRIIAAGTSAAWGGPPTLAANQNMPTRVRYWRKGQKEFTVGWDATIPNFGCHIFESRVGTAVNMCYLGAEPVSHTGVTATAGATGGKLGAGCVRIYLAWYGGSDSGPHFIGATDHATNLQVQVTGTANVNKITLAVLPTIAWTNSTHLYIFRTKVVGDSAQLDYEPAYFERSVVAGTATTEIGLIPDAAMTTRMQLEMGQYSWPYAKLHTQWLANLGIGEYQGRLLVWGAGYAQRLHISGYVNNDKEAALDDNSWAFDVDAPGNDTIVGVAPIGRRLLILGENGIYRLRDEDDLPDVWEMEQIARLRNESVDGFMMSGDNVFCVARDGYGDVNVYACDGYQLKRVGCDVARLVSVSDRLIDMDGVPMIAGAGDSDKRILYPNMVWGSMNAPAACRWTPGRYSTFRSGGLLLGTSAGVYYEGATYSSDESDYYDSREFKLDEEEYSEWQKVYIHAVRLSANNVTAKIYASVDGGAWTELGGSPITINSLERGIYELGLDTGTMRTARRIKFRVAFTAAQPAAITGITVQGLPNEWRE